MRSVGLSLVLGGRETTLMSEMTAYGVFANKGERKDLVSILKVADSKEKKLFEYKDHSGKKVLSEEIAFLISHILLDNNARSAAFGPSSFLNIPGHTVAVKTGTTNEKRDNWTVGYTPSYVVGVWVGNNDNSEMNQKIASGVTGASPIWHNLMVMALKGKTNEEFSKPDNVLAAQVDSMAGGQPAFGMSARSEYFVKGTEPTTKSPAYKDKDGKIYFNFREEDPVSQDGINRWQQAIDEWINTTKKDDEKYHPPGDLFGEGKKEEEHKDESPTATPEPSATPTP
jgi:membrane peptidoglycan carboxypeptidase